MKMTQLSLLVGMIVCIVTVRAIKKGDLVEYGGEIQIVKGVSLDPNGKWLRLNINRKTEECTPFLNYEANEKINSTYELNDWITFAKKYINGKSPAEVYDLLRSHYRLLALRFPKVVKGGSQLRRLL